MKSTRRKEYGLNIVYSLTKRLLNGIINMTFRKSNGEKEEVKMLNYKTNVPEIDSENETLFKAAIYLQMCGNEPGLTMSEFYTVLLAEDSGVSKEEFGKLTSAAVAIETMMQSGFDLEESEFGELTTH